MKTADRGIVIWSVKGIAKNPNKCSMDSGAQICLMLRVSYFSKATVPGVMCLPFLFLATKER